VLDRHRLSRAGEAGASDVVVTPEAFDPKG
jgi:hypothetical protein